jgi:hypothetical protein
MKAMIARTAAVVILCAGLVLVTRETAVSQPKKTGAFAVIPLKGAPKPKLEFVDVGYCLKCHKLSPDELANQDVEADTRKLVIYNEIRTWNDHDLHRSAYLNIVPDEKAGPSGNLAWRMQHALRQTASRKQSKPDAPLYEVAKASECLVCHAVDTKLDPKTQTSPAIGVGDLDPADDPRFDIRFGVSCEACHGIVQEKWALKHAVPTWRDVHPAEKLKSGQIDLRDPVVRSQRCSSCHIGSAKENKIVTHEMYAAGHPPLPPLEMGAFAKEQPYHFYHRDGNEYFKEELQKKDNKKSVYDRFHYREGESTEARMLAHGSIVGLQSSLEMYAAETGKNKDGLLDFAHFDCASCHHDLKNPGERQTRPGGITGRPPMKTQTDLLEAVVKHAADPTGKGTEDPKWVKHRNDLDTQLMELKTAFTARPFGDNKLVGDASKKLLATTNDILKNLEAIEYSDAAVKQLITVIKDQLTAKSTKGDYVEAESASQLSWALLSLLREVKDDAERKKLEDALKPVIVVALREPLKPDEPLESVAQRLTERQKKLNDYSSKKFLGVFSR